MAGEFLENLFNQSDHSTLSKAIVPSICYCAGATCMADPEPPLPPEELEKRRIENEKWEKERNIERYNKLKEKLGLDGFDFFYEIRKFKDFEELKCYNCKKAIGYGIFEAKWAEDSDEIQFCSEKCFNEACIKDKVRRAKEYNDFCKEHGFEF